MPLIVMKEDVESLGVAGRGGSAEGAGGERAEMVFGETVDEHFEGRPGLVPGAEELREAVREELRAATKGYAP